MKNFSLVLILICTIFISNAQSKGFYYASGLLATPIPSKLLYGISFNLGYSFGRSQISVYNRIGVATIVPLSIEYNYQIPSKSRIKTYGIIRGGLFNYWAGGSGIKRVITSERPEALDLGIGSKYYITNKTAIYLAPSISIFKGTNIYRSGILTPFTISIGICK
jgi:hypothetical protein